MSHLPRSPARSVAAAAALGILLAPAVAHARPTCTVEAPCPAAPKVAHIGTFNGGGKKLLDVKAAPRPGARTLRRVRSGQKALIVCQTRGARVRGPYGVSRIWDRLAHGGYMSDTRIHTGSDGRVAPDCGAGTPSPSPTPTPVDDAFVYDDPGAWVGPSGCSGGFSAGAAGLSAYLRSHHRFTRTIGGYACRQNTANPAQMSLHAEGRAVDWMASAQAAGPSRAVRRFIATVSAGNWRPARAMGIQELIWNHRIWTSARHREGWRAYTGPNPHTDHIHIGLNRAGAAKRTSFWR